MFAAAPLASASAFPSASRSRARQRVAPPSTPRVERRAGHAASPASVRSIIAAAAARSASAASVGVSRFALAPCGVCSGVTGKCTNTAGIARPLVAEILQGPEIEVVADKSAGVPRHPRRNSRLFNGSRYRPDRRRRLQPFGRGAGDPEPPSQGAVIVRRAWRRQDCARTARRRRRRGAQPDRSSEAHPAEASRSR